MFKLQKSSMNGVASSCKTSREMRGYPTSKLSIESTITQGGFPIIKYKTPRRRPHYLFLIDNRSPFDQRTKLYGHFYDILHQNGIDVDVFYFHTTPQVCWNPKHPQWCKDSLLEQLFANSYLILVTDGAVFVERGRLHMWVTTLFGGWNKRAILTPQPANLWGNVERGPRFILYSFADRHRIDKAASRIDGQRAAQLPRS
ncbi:MAG: hypothetical protein WDO15_06240 [Bacteroidota bacterium]